ncbi:hypothetical protein TWF481_006345 [Arthrobotrys musiformis]|uniref:Uncharacterized protein n=1 Tax=Arthrobotrys musiformis TaxID=47236 RepID=A0AAV9WIG0_9PEZI
MCTQPNYHFTLCGHTTLFPVQKCRNIVCIGTEIDEDDVPVKEITVEAYCRRCRRRFVKRI